MDYIIDYLTITIKSDKKASTPYPLELDDVLHAFGIYNVFGSDFISIGSRKFYQNCYTYNNIDFCIASPERIDDMGYCLNMTGQGCRFFESVQPDGFTWRGFFENLYTFVQKGCKVNIARIDFAFDDIVKENEIKSPLLDLNVIEECRKSHLFTSLYRVSAKKEYDNFMMKSSVCETLVNKTLSKTIYFGSRKSNSFCRFYDKNVEKLQKLKSIELKEYQDQNIKHWVRFEIVFKNSVAIKIINSMIHMSEELFSKYFSEIINYYIRFINNDNDNRYKCSICDWWSKFLGTVEKMKIKCNSLVKNPLTSAMKWLARSVAPTAQAVRYALSTDEFIKFLDDFSPISRFKDKHLKIASTSDFSDKSYSDYDYWQSLIPLFIKDVNNNSGYLYVEKLGLFERLSD